MLPIPDSTTKCPATANTSIGRASRTRRARTSGTRRSRVNGDGWRGGGGSVSVQDKGPATDFNQVTIFGDNRGDSFIVSPTVTSISGLSDKVSYTTAVAQLDLQGGAGADSFNVGSNGAAFGVANKTTLDVYQVLLAANKQARNGLLYNGDPTLDNEAVAVFGALNDAGGI